MHYDLMGGKTLEEWKKLFPLMDNIVSTREVFWSNPQYQAFEEATTKLSLGEADVKMAVDRLTRFATYIVKVFPETKDTLGLIESPLKRIPKMMIILFLIVNYLRPSFHITPSLSALLGIWDLV